MTATRGAGYALLLAALAIPLPGYAGTLRIGRERITRHVRSNDATPAATCRTKVAALARLARSDAVGAQCSEESAVVTGAGGGT